MSGVQSPLGDENLKRHTVAREPNRNFGLVVYPVEDVLFAAFEFAVRDFPDHGQPFGDPNANALAVPHLVLVIPQDPLAVDDV
jgi:hypothetical protein